jgi:hypothetical protein
MIFFARFLRTLPLLFLVIGFLTPALADNATRSEAPTQPQLAKLLAEPLPGHASQEAAASFYKPDTLYQYIDGGADVYLLYDFQVLLHQDFKSGVAELTADIYDMGTTEDAFGVYSAERSPKYNYIPVGAEGYRSKGVLNFFQDRYYVKLAGSGTGADALLDQLAHTLSTRMGGSRTIPALLLKFPQLHRVRHSEQYIRKDPLGHAFLAPAYLAAYQSTSQESKLVVSVAKDAAGAKSRLDQLANHFHRTGKCAPAADLGENGIRGKNSFEGSVSARTQGRYLLVLLNPAQNGDALLKSTALALR